MNSFSLNRFLKTLYWVLSVGYRKMLLWYVGSVTLVVFIGELLFQKMNSFPYPYTAIHDYAQLGVGLFIIVSLIMISLFAFDYNNKRRRTTLLMLPSSNLEKYLSLLVFTSVIGIACLFLAIVMGDSLRMAWNWMSDYNGPKLDCVMELRTTDGISYHWWSSAIPLLIKEITPDAITNPMGLPTDWVVMNCLLTVCFWLWLHSFYTLNGTLFRKYSFVVTSVCVLASFLILVKMMAYFKLNMFHISWVNGELKEYEIGVMPYVLSVVLPIITVFNYWASFRIFKGFQLMTNKWTNYDILKR